MPNMELANTSNAIAVYAQPEAIEEKIINWIQNPSTYDDSAQLFFVHSINRFSRNVIASIESHVKSLRTDRLRAITTYSNSDIASLKLKPSLIAKSFGCGTIRGLAASQIVTQVTVVMAIALFTTPMGWIGRTGSAVVYCSFKKQG